MIVPQWRNTFGAESLYLRGHAVSCTLRVFLKAPAVVLMLSAVEGLMKMVLPPPVTALIIMHHLGGGGVFSGDVKVLRKLRQGT